MSRRSRRSRRPSDGPAIPRIAWQRLAVCTGAAALLQIDGTLMTVALPSLGDHLHVGSHTTSWVLTTYFLAYAAALFPGGRLVDRRGARPAAMAGLALFAAGALLGAVAPSFGWLVASRVVQGLGAGLVSPAALAGAVSGFPPARRGMALGIWGAGSGVANLFGPLLGGLLTVAFDWRANWWALIPLALGVAAAVARLLPAGVRAAPAAPLSRETRGRVAASAVLATLTFTVLIGTFFLAQQYLQVAQGYSALGAAAALVLVAVLTAVAAPLAGRLADVRGDHVPLLSGLVIAAAGLAVLGIPGVPLHGVAAIVLIVPVGLGLGLLFTPTSRAALNAVPQASHGRVSATLSAGRLVGGALGAGLAGLAVAGGVSTANVHVALLGAAALCLVVGVPVAARLRDGAGDPAQVPV